MADQLLATKLRLPRIRPDAVPRPRLVRRFDLALAGSLTLISAPAGFGKTTALRQWVDRCARPVAWLTLDDGDNDPPRFWSHLRAALRSAGLGLDRSWPPPGPESAPPSSQQHIADLLNQLAACETRFALVLDDFHTISDRSVTVASGSLPRISRCRCIYW